MRAPRQAREKAVARVSQRPPRGLAFRKLELAAQPGQGGAGEIEAEPHPLAHGLRGHKGFPIESLPLRYMELCVSLKLLASGLQ
jgi:hypothetical protein